MHGAKGCGRRLAGPGVHFANVVGCWNHPRGLALKTPKKALRFLMQGRDGCGRAQGTARLNGHASACCW